MTTKLFSKVVIVALCVLGACAPASPGSDASTDSMAMSGDAAAPSAECMEYCTTASFHCDGANQLYPNDAACLGACASFSRAGMRGDRAGNSVWCRLYHVDQPAAMDPATHCPHASASGGGVCQ